MRKRLPKSDPTRKWPGRLCPPPFCDILIYHGQQNCYSPQLTLENAPTCYRAPKWPAPEFPRKIPKKYPPGRNSGLPEFTPKIPGKYRKKYPQNTKNAHFRYFFGISGVFSLDSRISARGVFFRYFSWKFRGGPFRGSVAGRGVLKLTLRQLTTDCSYRFGRAQT